MSELTYKQKLRDRVREAKEQEVVEFKKTDEPDYTAFFDAVQTVFVRYYDQLIWTKKLYRLWFISETFRKQWQNGGKGADVSMLFSAFRYGFSLEEARCLYLAWTQSRGRKISKAEFQQWDKDVLQWVWQSAQPYIQKYEKEQERERQRQKELRKERRQERHQHKLRTLVLNALAAHPSTIAVIAKELNESYRAVENHMLRHLKAGKVKRIGRGLYASASFDSTVVQMTASDSVQTTLNGVHDVFRKDNDDDFFEKCFTPRKRDTTGENTCYATPSSGQSRSTRYSAKELGNEPLDEYRDTASPGTLCLMDTRTGLLMLSGELQEGTVERTLLIFRRLNLSVQEISSLARPVSDTHKSEPRP